MERHFGPYRLIARIALGDLAEVFTAARKQEQGGADTELYALKRLNREQRHKPEVRALFARECALTMQLDHPNVVRGQATDSVADQPYLAMTYIAGASVQTLAEATGSERLPAGAIARIGLDTCAALTYLHSARDEAGQLLAVVHRDLAPRNIQCSTSGVAKLIDFSAARSHLSPPEDRTVRGTYAYMSPEQVRGQPLDGRSDVFSLGAVLWELFAGQRLFRRAAHYLTLAAVVEQPAPTLREFAERGGPASALGAAAPAIDEVLGRALAKDRAERFADADELARALNALVERFGWDARPSSLAERVRALATETNARTGA